MNKINHTNSFFFKLICIFFIRFDIETIRNLGIKLETSLVYFELLLALGIAYFILFCLFKIKSNSNTDYFYFV